MRPVAEAFDRMAGAARREAGPFLSINSAFRSDAEQARLFAAKPKPHLFTVPEPQRKGAGRLLSCQRGRKPNRSDH
jgi:hypothetical protein